VFASLLPYFFIFYFSPRIEVITVEEEEERLKPDRINLKVLVHATAITHDTVRASRRESRSRITCKPFDVNVNVNGLDGFVFEFRFRFLRFLPSLRFCSPVAVAKGFCTAIRDMYLYCQ